jgi:hypothetical protein
MAEILINGRTFKTDPLPATKGLALALRFARIVAPVLPLLDAKALETLDSGFLATVADSVIAFDGQAAIALMTDLAEMCHVDGQPVVVDANVQDAGELMEVALWCAGEQLRPFTHGGGIGRAFNRLTGILAG